MDQGIRDYHDKQDDDVRAVCEKLYGEIVAALPEAESKVWHGSPVWFLDGNPVVGYHKLKAGVRLLFWSGRSFDEPGLKPEGSFKAAEAMYKSLDDIDTVVLRAWLAKARDIQWDYKNIIKRRGELILLKGPGV
ncbi:MAG: DUF1801 domain-containing protein [Fimbriimonadaceae bacterium]|nr:DUF1801 domain-containing protein [Fimbriimonadaceae bacterium]